MAMGGSVGGGATGGTWTGGAGTWTNATNPSTATYTASASETGSIALTLTSSGGSCGTIFATKTITVNPNPTANVGGALTAICQSGTSMAMGGSVGGGATGGTWTHNGAGSITNATNPSTATYTASGSETGTITLTLTTNGGSCGTISANKSLTVNVFAYTWTGNSSSVWDDSTNWSCGVRPSSVGDAFIPGGAVPYPVIGNGPVAVVRDLTVQSPATLTVSGTGKLQVYGNWVNGGTFTPNSGTVEFLGTSGQGITNAGTEHFYNLTVNKSSGTVTVNANTEIQAQGSGTLSVLSGTLDVASGKKVTFRSVAPVGQVDQTARLGQVVGTITPTSTFASERYIGSPGSRLPYVTGTRAAPSITLAPSLKNVTAGDWSDNINVTYGSSSSTLSGYSELNISGVDLQDRINRGWRFVLNNATALSLGKGYRIFAGLDASDDVVSVTGNVQTGNYWVPVTYTAVGTQGWNLLGNPYPCEINFDDLYAANSSVIQPNMYIMDPYNSTNGASFNNSVYYTYNAVTNIAVDPRNTLGTTRTAATGKYIPSSQGFFVNALSSITTGNVLFTESMKPLAPYTSVYGNFRQGEEKQLVRLSVSDASGRDQAVVHFTGDAGNAYDELYDAQSLSSGSINIYTVASNKNLVINGLRPVTAGLKVPLVVKSKTLGRKRLSVDENTVSFGKLYIKDKYMGTTTLLGANAVYEFDITSDTNSSSAGRFTIVASSGVVTDLVTEGGNNGPSAGRMEVYPNPYTGGELVVSVNSTDFNVVGLEIMDVAGVVVGNFGAKDFVGTPDGLTLRVDMGKFQLPAGVYLVKCRSGEKSYIERLVISK